VPCCLLALGADHRADRPVKTDGWPAGLAEIVNADNRVHGYFVNWQDVFFFRGDTGALNAFMDKCAKLPGTMLKIVIHPGKLEVKSPWDKAPRDIAANWQLYTTPFERQQLENDHVKPGPFVSREDEWLGETLKLADIKIPANVTVESGGEIEAFVKNRATTQPAKPTN
jgi:hypothetical protein